MSSRGLFLSVRVATLAIAGLLFFGLLFYFVPRTPADLALSALAVVLFYVSSGAWPTAIRIGGVAIVLSAGFLAANRADVERLRHTLPHGEGFEISVPPERQGTLYIVDLAIDGTYIDVRSVVAAGEVKPFSERGVSSSDHAFLLRWPHPYRTAHVSYMTSPDGLDMLIADGHQARRGSTQAAFNSTQRYFFSIDDLDAMTAITWLVVAVGVAIFLLGTLSFQTVQRTALIGAFITLLITFFLSSLPGQFNPDSVNQYNQCTTGTYFDWHPVAISALACTTRLLIDSPILFVSLQMGAYAVLMLAILHSLERRYSRAGGGSLTFMRTTFCLLAFSPTVLVFLPLFGGDVPFGVFLLAFVAICSQLIPIHARSLRVTASSVALIGGALSRPNGIGIPLIMTALCFVVRFKLRRDMMLSCALSITAFVAFKLAIHLAGIRSPGLSALEGQLLALPTQTLASAFLQGDQSVAQIVNEIFDVERLRIYFNPYNWSSIQYTAFRAGEPAAHIAETLRGWGSVIISHPRLAIGITLTTGWTIFSPIQITPFFVQLAPTGADLPQMWAMVKAAPPFDARSFTPAVGDVITAANTAVFGKLGYLLLGTSACIWLSLASIIAIRRRNIGLFVSAAAVIGFLLVLGFTIPAPDLRYSWFAFPLCAILLCSWIGERAIMTVGANVSKLTGC